MPFVLEVVIHLETRLLVLRESLEVHSCKTRCNKDVFILNESLKVETETRYRKWRLSTAVYKNGRRGGVVNHGRRQSFAGGGTCSSQTYIIKMLSTLHQGFLVTGPGGGKMDPSFLASSREWCLALL